MVDTITIALAKGRLTEKALPLLEACGLNCDEIRHPDRRLVLFDEARNFRFVLVKPADVPIYVERGVADLGIVGKDTLLEKNASLYEMLDLGYGRCRLCIAGYADRPPLNSAYLRVATKYPHIARSYYAGLGQSIDIIELSGSVELGPLIGLSDVILDIVESGGTLNANGLTVLEEICEISARLVVNRVSLKTKVGEIRPLIEKMAKALEEEKKNDLKN